jgi:hypothetical protein
VSTLPTGRKSSTRGQRSALKLNRLRTCLVDTEVGQYELVAEIAGLAESRPRSSSRFCFGAGQDYG